MIGFLAMGGVILLWRVLSYYGGRFSTIAGVIKVLSISQPSKLQTPAIQSSPSHISPITKNYPNFLISIRNTLPLVHTYPPTIQLSKHCLRKVSLATTCPQKVNIDIFSSCIFNHSILPFKWIGHKHDQKNKLSHLHVTFAQTYLGKILLALGRKAYSRIDD